VPDASHFSEQPLHPFRSRYTKKERGKKKKESFQGRRRRGGIRGGDDGMVDYNHSCSAA